MSITHCPHCEGMLPVGESPESCPHCGEPLAGTGTLELPPLAGRDTVSGGHLPLVSVDDEGPTDATFISDEWPELEAAPGMKTEEIRPDSVDDGDGGDDFPKTMVSDEFPVPLARDANPDQTIAGEVRAGESPGGNASHGDGSDGDASDGSANTESSQTLLSDECDLSSKTLLSDDESIDVSSKTLLSDDGSQDLSSKTLISADGLSVGSDESPRPANGEELRTLASNWSGAEADHPGQTIKSRPDLDHRDSGNVGNTLDLLPKRHLSRTDAEEGPAGKLVHPEYELVKVLGEGGMGIVWDARQTSVDRSVALKMIKGPLGAKRTQRQKFLAEAVVTGDLDHPNIVPIYDVGTDAGGTLFYSMKRVQGIPWLKVIKQKSLRENVEILMRVADATAFAHARGIIHRDLKPENVMLGEFGEVLVMDWGLALPTQQFRKGRRIAFSASMGGTPAYMAPEMATGPIERVTTASDIYLLGAILYEIVTSRPPHPGRKVQECLLAAMRNTIAPTTISGELMDIAYRAMSTEPLDRYATVQEFQQALRGYQSHEESLAMATRARADLALAEKSGEYADFAKAVFGFEEAYALWRGNSEAALSLSDARLAYARAALRKGDFDLGTSLLDRTRPDHAEVLAELQAAQHEREARKHRLALAKRLMTAMAAGIFLIVSVAFLWIRKERNDAIVARNDAVKARDEADSQRTIAVQQTRIAEQERDEADRQRGIAVEQTGIAQMQRDEATRQKGIAEQQTEIARTERMIAQKERDEAKKQKGIAEEQTKIADKERLVAQMERDEAKKQKGIADEQKMKADEQRAIAIGKQQEAEDARNREEYEAYIARIGLAAAKIDENAFDVALELLEQCKPELRNWEWGRLMHLCRQASRKIPADGPVDSVAYAPDGARFVTGSWDGMSRILEAGTGQVVRELPYGGNYVHAVAWSPDGRLIAAAGNDSAGYVQLWNAADGVLAATVGGHTDAVVGATFSDDSRWLLTTSYDETARLWDISDLAAPRETYVFRGHNWWVWNGAFFPGFAPDSPEATSRLVTVSQDGKAIVWALTRREGAGAGAADEASYAFVQDRIFTGHEGPVYGVDVSPDGRTVATSGYDNRVLLWEPEELAPYDFGSVFDENPPPQPYRSLSGHIAPVQSVAFSADGALVVSGSRDNSVKVWDVASGETLKTFRGHHSGVRDAAFSPDGRTVVSGGQDEQAIVWTIDDYEEFRVLNGRQLTGHEDAVLSADFSRDGARIVTASRDRTARTWDAHTAQLLQTFQEGHQYLATSAVFFPNGRSLATSAADNSVRLWNVSSGTEFRVLPETGISAALAISDDGQWLATGSDDNSVKLWSVAELLDEGEVAPRRLVGHNGGITALAFAPQSAGLASADANGRCIYWNLATGEPRWSVRHHERRINALAFLPDGRTLLTASNDHTVGWTDVANGEENTARLLKPGRPVLAVAVTRDGTHIVTVSDLNDNVAAFSSRITVWNAADATVLRTIDRDRFAIHSLSISPDGATAIAGCSDNTVRKFPLDGDEDAPAAPPFLDFARSGGIVWAAAYTADGQAVLTVGGSDARLFRADDGHPLMTFSPHGAVASARFSPDGTRIVTGSWDNSARIWNAETGKGLLKLENGHSGYINTTVYSPDGARILTASDDGTAKVWDASTGIVVATCAGHTGPVHSAVFSADGRWILTASRDKTARIWDADTGEAVGEPFTGHSWGVLCAAFSSDGTRIVTGSEDNEARVWDVASRATVAILTGHTAAITSAAFAEDGLRILTGSQDNTAKLWDVSPGREGKEILTLKGHSREVTSVRLSPDGRSVLTASRDGTAVLWLTADWEDADPSKVASH